MKYANEDDVKDKNVPANIIIFALLMSYVLNTLRWLAF